ncbi:MAG: SDR family NAD(P)-dependent oxidoreductase [Paracoccaceae bacterium]
MPAIRPQSLDLTAHHDRYPAIDPRAALKDSAAGKVVFLSGASRGIGAATALAFAEAGARAVYLTARSDAALEETASRLRAACPDTLCAWSVCDVTDPDAVAAAVADCVTRFGGIDIADANAGFLGPWVKIGESDPAGWWTNWVVNLRGAYHVARFTLPHLIESASGRGPPRGAAPPDPVLDRRANADARRLDYQTSVKHAVNRLVESIPVRPRRRRDQVLSRCTRAGSRRTGLTMPGRMHAYLNDTLTSPPVSRSGSPPARRTGPRDVISAPIGTSTSLTALRTRSSKRICWSTGCAAGPESAARPRADRNGAGCASSHIYPSH